MGATQLQIRRGTTAQNNSFIGAMGEITFDTTTKSLRLHDGVTVGGRAIPTYSGVVPEGGDYVVVSYYAADGSSWYRQYQSGWVEQGGKIVTTATARPQEPVTLPIAMATAVYHKTKQLIKAASLTTGFNWIYIADSQSGVTDTATTIYLSIPANSVCTAVNWEVKGMAA